MLFENMVENFIRIATNHWKLFLVEGLLGTLRLTAIAVAFGIVFGSLLAMVRRSRIAPFRWLAAAYVEVIRGTPLLLQLYLFYFMIPSWFSSFDISPFASVAIALSFNSAAYVSEVVRAGIQAVDRGQAEAARCLGLSHGQSMLHVVLPQAVKNILPALANEFVQMLKETSLAATFLVGDLMTTYKIVNGQTFLTLEPLVLVGLIYFVLTFIISKIVGAFERKMAHSD